MTAAPTEPLIKFDKPPQRVLIIKPSAIGDVVHTLPVWNLLRKHWPASQISWLVTPTCAGLLDGQPGLNVIRFERGRLARAWRSRTGASELKSLRQSLRHQFDLVIDLQGLFRSGWMAWETRAPVRVGFANAREFAPLFYTHRVPIETPDQHALSRYLKVIEALGCPTSPIEFPFVVTEADRAHVDRLLPGDARFAVLLPGTNWPTKRWPAERFAELVEPLRKRLGLASVVAGGPDAMPIAQQMPGVTNVVGRTTLPQLVALLERGSLVVANDSGPMHIAAALGRPLVTLFGPTNPVRTGPYARDDTVLRLAIPCSPCYSRTCAHQSCLRWLGVEPVLELARRQLAKDRAPVSPHADV
jgi:lipopolysaccharide heptosyltransferase I